MIKMWGIDSLNLSSEFPRSKPILYDMFEYAIAMSESDEFFMPTHEKETAHGLIQRGDSGYL